MSQPASLKPSPPLAASSSRFLHAAAATASRDHTLRVTPAPPHRRLHGMPSPAKQPCYPNPPPLSHSLAFLVSNEASPPPSCHANSSSGTPATEHLSAPTAGPLCAVNVAKSRPAFFSLPFPSYKLYPTVLPSFQTLLLAYALLQSTRALFPNRAANRSCPPPPPRFFYCTPCPDHHFIYRCTLNLCFFFWLCLFAHATLLTGRAF